MDFPSASIGWDVVFPLTVVVHFDSRLKLDEKELDRKPSSFSPDGDIITQPLSQARGLFTLSPLLFPRHWHTLLKHWWCPLRDHTYLSILLTVNDGDLIIEKLSAWKHEILLFSGKDANHKSHSTVSLFFSPNVLLQWNENSEVRWGIFLQYLKW